MSEKASPWFFNVGFNGMFFFGIVALIITVFFGIPLMKAVTSNKLILYIFGGILLYALVKRS